MQNDNWSLTQGGKFFGTFCFFDAEWQSYIECDSCNNLLLDYSTDNYSLCAYVLRLFLSRFTHAIKEIHSQKKLPFSNMIRLEACITEP